jgi:hypothetical protein
VHLASLNIRHQNFNMTLLDQEKLVRDLTLTHQILTGLIPGDFGHPLSKTIHLIGRKFCKQGVSLEHRLDFRGCHQMD